MNGIEAIKTAKALLTAGKVVTVEFPDGSRKNYNNIDCLDNIAEFIADDPDSVFAVTECPTKITKQLLGEVWDSTKPASSPAAASNQFYARMVAKLESMGLLNE